MRKIERDEFWQNVRGKNGTEIIRRMQEVVKRFERIGGVDTSIEGFDELANLLTTQLAPILQELAEINGCNETHHTETLYAQAAEFCVKAKEMLELKLDPLQMFTRALRELVEEYAREKKCHYGMRMLDAYFCYCDERS